MKYLITGGTGSFGTHFVDWLYHNTDDEVVVYSRDELKQWQMRKQYGDRVQFIIGDVRDAFSTLRVMEGVDRVVHAAALKHVHTGEEQPWESIQTNLVGTKHVVEACNSAGAKMVLLSTDKAVEPVNAYGATKMLAERLTLAGGQKVVRYGNVFGSRGSVLHIFKDQAAKGHEFTITDGAMTRFIITFEQAISVVMSAFENDKAITIPELKSIYITDLARAFDEKATFKEIGIQAGEKLAEKLDLWYTSDRAEKLSVEEIRRLIDGTV